MSFDDFSLFAKCKCYVNNSTKNRYLPFNMNYFMFDILCNQDDSELTDSEIYDKYILLSDLWSKMNSQIIFSRLSYEQIMEVRYGRRKKEVSCD